MSQKGSLVDEMKYTTAHVDYTVLSSICIYALDWLDVIV